jgi:hypothetical protein
MLFLNPIKMVLISIAWPKGLFVLLFVCNFLCAKGVVGVASAIDKPFEHQYNEKRALSDDERGSFTTEYSTSSGEIFAKKSINVSNTSWQPHVVFADSRLKVKYEVISADDKVKISYSSPDNSYSKQIDLQNDLTWDAGIHFYIKEHFEELKRQAKKVNVFLPDMGDFYSFKIYSKVQANGDVLVIMKPTNFFLRLIVSELKVWYDANNNILKYEGVSDIKNAAGDNFETQIIFRYI